MSSTSSSSGTRSGAGNLLSEVLHDQLIVADRQAAERLQRRLDVDPPDAAVAEDELAHPGMVAAEDAGALERVRRPLGERPLTAVDDLPLVVEPHAQLTAAGTRL